MAAVLFVVLFHAGRAVTLVLAFNSLSCLAALAWIAAGVLAFRVPLARSQIPPQQRPTPAEPRSKPPVQPPFVPGEPSEIEIPRPPEVAPPNADQIKFVLRDVIIDGATIYSAEQLRQFYAGLVNT